MPEKTQLSGVPQLLTLEQARAAVLAEAQPLPPETAPLSNALNRVLAADLIAPFAVPPFATSAMDGYALSSAEAATASPDSAAVFPVSHAIGAGDAPSGALQPQTAARIMTGAPVPPGADCVVPMEEVGGSEAAITIAKPPQAGSHIRAAGNDIRQGETLFSGGTPVTPAAAGVIASVGITEIAVHRAPRVAIISTGKELAPAGATLQPGQIHDANTPALALSAQLSGAQPQPRDPIADTHAAAVAALREATDCDLIVTSGGVSVGDHDFIKEAIAELGEVRFWKVRVRPGKPLVFGVISNTPVLGLPGNPVSALVSFALLCRPLIRRMQGLPPGELPRVQAILEDDLINYDAREVYARVSLRRDENGELRASLASNQSSGALKALAHSSGLAVCPADVPKLPAGTRVPVALPQLPEEAAEFH